MTQFSLLRRRRFAPLFVTQFLGAFNDNLFKTALIILITFHVDAPEGRDSAILVTLSAGIFILPFFLFSAIAGQIADKYEKAALIRRIKLAEICIMSLAALGFYLHSVAALMAVLFLMGTQSAAFGPLKYGILPQHLHEAELTGGNGLIQMGTFVAIITGMAVGGSLAAIPDVGPLIAAAMAVTVAVFGWLASCAIPRAEPADAGLGVDLNIFRQTVRILGFAAENRVVLVSIVGISWFWFVGATFMQLLPSYTRDVLGGDAHAVTLTLTAFALGVGAGSLLCNLVSRGHIEPGISPLGAVGITLFGVAAALYGPSGTGAVAVPADLLSFAFAGGNWKVLACFAALAAFGGLYIVPLYALVQARSVPARRSRIIAANNVLNALFMVGSAAMSVGLLAAGMSIAGIFLVVAVVNVVVTAAVFAPVPEFLRYVRRPFSRGPAAAFTSPNTDVHKPEEP